MCVESILLIRKESLADHQSSKKALRSATFFSTGNKNIAPQTKAMHIRIAVNSSCSLTMRLSFLSNLDG